MATIWSALGEIMVLVGDLLALVAVAAGLLALIGQRQGWNRQSRRQIWSNGIFAVLLGGVGLVAKLTTPEMATEANGYLFGLSNGVVGGLLLVAVVFLGIAYWLQRQQPEL